MALPNRERSSNTSPRISRIPRSRSALMAASRCSRKNFGSPLPLITKAPFNTPPLIDAFDRNCVFHVKSGLRTSSPTSVVAIFIVDAGFMAARARCSINGALWPSSRTYKLTALSGTPVSRSILAIGSGSAACAAAASSAIVALAPIAIRLVFVDRVRP